MIVRRSIFSLALMMMSTFVAKAQTMPSAPTPAPTTLAFVAHAAFFSLEAKQPALVDPQAFVAAPGAPAATGLQGIAHVAGVRNALMVDDPSFPALSADGKPLGFTLVRWFGASGSVELTPFADATGTHERITVRCSHLVSGGHYSLFENHFDRTPVGFTPLDGSGTHASFVASKLGEATTTVVAPEPLTHDNAVLLIYHSDGLDHGVSRGSIGIDAHHQLIARIP